MDAQEIEEVGSTADALRGDIELLFVRGLGSSTPKDRKPIELRADEWERIGAHHVAAKLRAALLAAKGSTKDAPSKFLSAYTSLHTFERVLSLDAAKHAWAQHLGEPAVSTPKPQETSKPAPLEDPKGARAVLRDLAHVVEDLVQTGLVSATGATRTKLDAAFKEASRRKLLRLGASLRYVNEEIGRFLADDGTFSPRRYGFFLHRSWLLAKGTLHALEKDDATLVGALTVGISSAPKPVARLELVTLGIGKRVVASACTFDFRMRVVKGDALVGQSLVFSLVFARKKDVLAEAYLHLPQPQKFAPKLLRERARIVVTEAAVLPGRLLLGPKSTVTLGGEVDAWPDHYTWDPRIAAVRVESHVPSPLDLAVEMQEEIILDDWSIVPKPAEKHPFVVHTEGLAFDVVVEGKELRERLDAVVNAKKKPRLFGTVHYEAGRLVLAPLSFLEEEGPDHIQLSDEKINLTALVGSLNIG